MTNQNFEIQLAQQLAATLMMPIFLVDTEGSLIFYNEPAEIILGRRFHETGEMAASVWSRIFIPTDEFDQPLFPETLPLMIALNERHPAHGQFWIRGIDNIRRQIEVVAFPLTTKNDRHLGAIAIFWEIQEK